MSFIAGRIESRTRSRGDAQQSDFFSNRDESRHAVSVEAQALDECSQDGMPVCVNRQSEQGEIAPDLGQSGE